MDDLKPRWTTWAGGDFLPVPPEMRVSVLLRDGSIEGPSAAREFAGADSCWRHRGSAGDIVAYAEADDRDAHIAELTERNEGLERLFDIQWARTREAGELWRHAHPGNELVSPDLGELVKWLMDRATAAEERLKEADRVIGNLLECYRNFQKSSGNMEEAYYKLAKYAYAQWEDARAFLDTQETADD